MGESNNRQKLAGWPVWQRERTTQAGDSAPADGLWQGGSSVRVHGYRGRRPVPDGEEGERSGWLAYWLGA